MVECKGGYMMAPGEVRHIRGGPIHRSAWKGISANFALTEFSEVESVGLRGREAWVVRNGATLVFAPPVELLQQGRGYLLHYPDLSRRQVLPPASGRALATVFALSLMLAGDVLPRVLLHRPQQLLLAHRDV